MVITSCTIMKILYRPELQTQDSNLQFFEIILRIARGRY